MLRAFLYMHTHKWQATVVNCLFDHNACQHTKQLIHK